jgi:hypothetical protein
MKEKFMSPRFEEMTVDQLLNDPMTLAVMKADRVNPATLKDALSAFDRRRREDIPLNAASPSPLSGSAGFIWRAVCSTPLEFGKRSA